MTPLAPLVLAHEKGYAGLIRPALVALLVAYLAGIEDYVLPESEQRRTRAYNRRRLTGFGVIRALERRIRPA